MGLTAIDNFELVPPKQSADGQGIQTGFIDADTGARYAMLWEKRAAINYATAMLKAAGFQVAQNVPPIQGEK